MRYNDDAFCLLDNINVVQKQSYSYGQGRIQGGGLYHDFLFECICSASDFYFRENKSMADGGFRGVG